MKIEIVKENRRTTVLHVLDCEHAVLKTSKKTTAKQIDDFLASKQGWLYDVSKKMRDNVEFLKDLQVQKYAYIYGKKVGAFHDLIFGFDFFASDEREKQIKNFYLSHFDILKNRAKEISQKTGLECVDVKPTSSVRIWGSFNTKKEMKLNYKLLLLPEKLVDYVVCHELCHGLQMNHSPKFWANLQKICPDARKLKKELSVYSALLKKVAFLEPKNAE